VTGKARAQVELANKIARGQAVGNLWGAAFVDERGCRHGWLLEPQESEEAAREFVRRWDADKGGKAMATKWRMQVLMPVPGQGETKEKVWRDVHPTDKPPYEHDTEEEAKRMLRLIYPGCGSDEVRVREVIS
jgi:hypothetical protein